MDPPDSFEADRWMHPPDALPLSNADFDVGMVTPDGYASGSPENAEDLSACLLGNGVGEHPPDSFEAVRWMDPPDNFDALPLPDADFDVGTKRKRDQQDIMVTPEPSAMHGYASGSPENAEDLSACLLGNGVGEQEEAVRKLPDWDCDNGMSPCKIGEILHEYNEQCVLPQGIPVFRSWPSKKWKQQDLEELGVPPGNHEELESGVWAPRVFIR